VYLEAARRIGEVPAHCLVFEDSLVGVQAARRAGMRAIGVTTAHTDDELRAAGAEATITNFEGLEWSAVATREARPRSGAICTRADRTAGSWERRLPRSMGGSAEAAGS